MADKIGAHMAEALDRVDGINPTAPISERELWHARNSQLPKLSGSK